MTKPTIKSARMEALEQLSSKIERRLESAGPEGLTIPEAAEGLGFALGTIRARMGALLESGRIYREKHIQTPRTAIYFTYHAVEPVARDVDADAPRRISSRTYPTINRRDDLVAALFGPARKEVA